MSKVAMNEKLFGSLAPLFKLSKILGLCPTKSQRQKNKYALSFSWKYYIYGIVISSITVLWSFWGFVKDMIEASFLTLGFRGTIDFVIASFDFSEIVLTAFYFIISTPSKSRHVSKIIKNFDKIDEILTTVPVHKIRIFLTFFTIFMPVLYILDLFMWGNNSWTGFSNYCGFYISYTVVILHEIQYWHLVNLARTRIRTLNAAIEQQTHKNPSLDFVKNIIKIHDRISDSIHDINQCFNFSTTIIILSCYVHLALNPYMLFVIATSNDANFFNFVYFLWIFVQIFRLGAILEICNSCKQESEQTVRLVCRLLIRNLKSDFKNELRCFVFKLFAQRTVFSSYALDNIDRSLIFGIIGSISTYWMILMQFSARTISFS